MKFNFFVLIGEQQPGAAGKQYDPFGLILVVPEVFI